ncbi:MAG: hypothetical protein KF901_13220 [Myxococcales bacterium]|nr:hypothetical protein [Myxococcales bacterium]
MTMMSRPQSRVSRSLGVSTFVLVALGVAAPAAVANACDLDCQEHAQAREDRFQLCLGDGARAIGETECRRFGSGWARAAHRRIRFSLAPGVRGVALEPPEDDPEGLSERQGANAWVGGATLRLEWLLLAYVNLGAELGIHLAPTRGAIATPAGAREVARLRTTDVGAVMGVEAPLFGIAGLGVELYAGFRSAWLIHYVDGERHIVWRARAAVVEPRVTFRVFVARHLSLGLRVGTNALALAEVHAALTLTVHVRRFDAHPHR